jgi:ABC-type dipeptide/oligopeptide/nickel transport system permease component
MGVGIISAFLTLFGNLLADIGYAWLDPRVHYD